MEAKEKGCELVLWDWLKKQQNVYEVYFNSKNEVKGKIFRVEGETKEIPDLLVACRLFGKEEYLAVEVKDADDSSNVFKGNKILDLYYNNYSKGLTKYFIGDKEVRINKFLVATQYSKFGKLFKTNEQVLINSQAYKEDSKNWLNKIVPKIEFSRTKDYIRNLIYQFSIWRKKNEKIDAGIGILISDISLKFTVEELTLQSGMIGEPMIQGVFFNPKLNRWQQTLIKL